METKILIVGDIHGDFGSLNALLVKKRPDIVLQTGDFGWWPKILGLSKGIKTCGADLYFCDGNHEDHQALRQNGDLRRMYEHVYHAERGSTIELPDGRVVLFAGGASSIDKNMRTAGHDWFPEETIKDRDLNKMLDHKKIDIVVSHTCPTTFLKHLCRSNSAKTKDPSCIALDYVLNKHKPEQWFFGHWHLQKEGYDKGCRWQCMDYPRHGGMSWRWLR